MSFNCDHCGFSNNELQSGSKIQEQGIRYEGHSTPITMSLLLVFVMKRALSTLDGTEIPVALFILQDWNPDQDGARPVPAGGEVWLRNHHCTRDRAGDTAHQPERRNIHRWGGHLQVRMVQNFFNVSDPGSFFSDPHQTFSWIRIGQ